MITTDYLPVLTECSYECMKYNNRTTFNRLRLFSLSSSIKPERLKKKKTAFRPLRRLKSTYKQAELIQLGATDLQRLMMNDICC